MSSKKKATRIPLAAHQTALPDNQRNACTEQFLRLGRSFFEHKVILSLPPNAFRLLLFMMLAAGPVSKCKIFPSHIPGMSKTTFYNSVQVLEACGIIKVVRLRMPGFTNNYQFTGEWSKFKTWDAVKRAKKVQAVKNE